MIEYHHFPWCTLITSYSPFLGSEFSLVMSNSETKWKEIRVISTAVQAEVSLYPTVHLIFVLRQHNSLILHLLLQFASHWAPAAPAGTVPLLITLCGLIVSQPQQQQDYVDEWQSPIFLVGGCLSCKPTWSSRPCCLGYDGQLCCTSPAPKGSLHSFLSRAGRSVLRALSNGASVGPVNPLG